MANTFELISSTTVGSGGAASIDFTSIPQTYTDLQLVVSGRITYNDYWLGLSFNGSTANFSRRNLAGEGSVVNSYTASSGANMINVTASGDTANTFGNSQMYIPNYTGSTYKSFSIDAVTENNATTALQVITAGLWSNTAAITSISLIPISSSNHAQYSSASLYGILKGSGGATVS